jgi:peptide/nickel transport system substrate-binding protein
MEKLRLLAASACLVAAAAGCGGGSSKTGSTTTKAASTPPLVTAASASKGKISEFSWALASEPTSLDWVFAYNYAENEVLSNVCENLLRLTPSETIAPSLAASYTHPSPTTWVYEIRPGVKFSDGQPLQASDVVFSLQRQLDKKVGSYYAGWWANVKSVRQTGPMQVTVTLSEPDELFNSMMATPAGGIAEKAYVQKKGSAYGTPDGGVMCTGPFKLQSWEKGQRIVLTRNAGYWDTALTPRAEKVTFPFLNNQTTRVSALVSGQVDGTWEVPATSIGQLSRAATGAMYYGKSMQSYDVIISSFKGALGDVRVRRALMMALDRQGIVDAALSGHAELLRAVVAPGSWGYDAADLRAAYEKLPPPVTDVKAAKALMAGVPSNKRGPVTLATLQDNAELAVTANALKAAGQSIGLKVNVQTLPIIKYNGLFFDPKARKGVDMFLTGWYSDVPDPLNVYSNIFLSTGASNFNGYRNQTVDKALLQARRTDDPNQRGQLVAQAQAAIVADVPWIPLYSPYVRVFMNKRLGGVPTTFCYLYYPWAAAVGAS